MVQKSGEGVGGKKEEKNAGDIWLFQRVKGVTSKWGKVQNSKCLEKILREKTRKNIESSQISEEITEVPNEIGKLYVDSQP